MKKYFVIIFLFALYSCTKNKSLFKEVDRNYYVSYEISNKNSPSDTLCTFYDFNDPSKVLKVGFYKDGFINGTWTYNQEFGIKEIEWAHYHDKYLKFDTNVFPVIDSIKYGNYFSKFLFRRGNSSIILSVSVNAPIKDSLPEINYDRITKSNLLSSNINVKLYESKKVINGITNLHLISSTIVLPKGGTKYIKGMFAFINKKDFIEISVTSSLPKDFYANELFYATVANFSLKNKFLCHE